MINKQNLRRLPNTSNSSILKLKKFNQSQPRKGILTNVSPAFQPHHLSSKQRLSPTKSNIDNYADVEDFSQHMFTEVKLISSKVGSESSYDLQGCSHKAEDQSNRGEQSNRFSYKTGDNKTLKQGKPDVGKSNRRSNEVPGHIPTLLVKQYKQKQECSRGSQEHISYELSKSNSAEIQQSSSQYHIQYSLANQSRVHSSYIVPTVRSYDTYQREQHQFRTMLLQDIGNIVNYINNQAQMPTLKKLHRFVQIIQKTILHTQQTIQNSRSVQFGQVVQDVIHYKKLLDQANNKQCQFKAAIRQLESENLQLRRNLHQLNQQIEFYSKRQTVMCHSQAHQKRRMHASNRNDIQLHSNHGPITKIHNEFTQTEMSRLAKLALSTRQFDEAYQLINQSQSSKQLWNYMKLLIDCLNFTCKWMHSILHRQKYVHIAKQLEKCAQEANAKMQKMPMEMFRNVYCRAKSFYARLRKGLQDDEMYDKKYDTCY